MKRNTEMPRVHHQIKATGEEVRNYVVEHWEQHMGAGVKESYDSCAPFTYALKCLSFAIFSILT